MPSVTVNRNLLFDLIGQKFTDEEFDKLCFEFGIELDEVLDPPLLSGAPGTGPEYKIDIPANRLDLLCVEGIATALAIFLGRIHAPRYTVREPQPANGLVTTHVAPSVAGVRPYIVTAVVRGVCLTPAVYSSFIDLQEKLHHNICRKRAFVAIGVHDLDTLTPPFTYSAEPPEAIRFQPLGQPDAGREFRADELLQFYATDSKSAHLKPYLHLIQKEPLYPVLRDSAGRILSLPPIINGEHSKLVPVVEMDQDPSAPAPRRTNIFIESTATDLTKATAVLDTLVAMLSGYSEKPHEAEATRVIYSSEGKGAASSEEGVDVYPKMAYKTEEVNVQVANETVGIQLDAEAMAASLTRMGLVSRVLDADAVKISVEVPPTRHDILHPCDIMEDIAIAYSYANIRASLPPTSTVGAQFPLNKLSRQLAGVIAQGGFTEALTFSLCSVDDECAKLRRPKSPPETLALVANPKAKDFQAVRLTLLPGLLKTLAANLNVSLPLKVFEISDVVHCEADTDSRGSDTGAVNRRHLCALHYGKTAGLELIHGLLDRVMLQLEAAYPEDYWLEALTEEAEDPTYFSGRCAKVLHRKRDIGRLGVLHPEVLQNFGLHAPCSVLEICIEGFI